MIVEWLVSVGLGFAGWLATLFPPIDIPTWVTDPITVVYDFLDAASGLGIWFPWAVLSAVVGGLVTIWLVTFGAKLVRAVASYLPFFGGAG